MSIEIQCSSCSHKLRVPESYAGKNGKCPKCSTRIKIPEMPNAQETPRPISSAATDTGLAPVVAAAPIVHPPIVAAEPNPYRASVSTNSESQSSLASGRLTLRRVDIVSVGTTLGVLYAMLGLIIGLVAGGLMAVGVTSSAGSAEMLGARTGGGIVIVVLAPIFYGVIGFIFGLILGFLYNLAARISGGIKFQT